MFFEIRRIVLDRLSLLFELILLKVSGFSVIRNSILLVEYVDNR
jgi:hypothetical protein